MNTKYDDAYSILSRYRWVFGWGLNCVLNEKKNFHFFCMSKIAQPRKGAPNTFTLIFS